jgi:NAD(P)-dependent dehydrogenase (short-subunit alcohol dehydrogenase family)
MNSLSGKVAFVTGAASGIGLGISNALAQAGVKVMMADIDDDALQKTAEKLRATNADVDTVKVDVSLKAELQRGADAVLARYGKLHILVSNAGVGGGTGYGNWTDASWDWTIGVNLMSVVWGFEIFGPLIERHREGGQIVNTASIAGLIPSTGPSYNVTKYGVVAMSEHLRPVMAERGIGVSVLCPGIIKTNIMDSRRHAQDRFGTLETPQPTPEQAARMAAFADMMAEGIDPNYVGELVREGIEGDWPYIFTDAQFEPLVEMRFAEIRKGFDRIRDRTPKR